LSISVGLKNLETIRLKKQILMGIVTRDKRFLQTFWMKMGEHKFLVFYEKFFEKNRLRNSTRDRITLGEKPFKSAQQLIDDNVGCFK